MTTVQASLNELNAFQEKEGYQLAGCGPRMKALAAEIKVLFPTLTAEDKGQFTAAVARGRFSIEAKYIWPLFCEAVGVAAPVAPAATNKVAGEILELCIGINLSQVKEHAILMDLVGMVSDLQKQVDALKKPAPRRVAKLAAV